MKNFQEISNQNRETVKYRIKTISDRTRFLWVYLPNEYKLATSLHDFKFKTKHWHCDKCVCRQCENFEQNLEFS